MSATFWPPLSAMRAWLTASVLSATLGWIQAGLWSLLRGLGTGLGGSRAFRPGPPSGVVLVLMAIKVPGGLMGRSGLGGVARLRLALGLGIGGKPPLLMGAGLGKGGLCAGVCGVWLRLPRYWS